MNTKLLFIVLLLFSFSELYAQGTVTGTITDASNDEPLPGVNISVKGTTIGTSSNENGSYELSVESLSDTLVFSYIGYQQKEVPINERTRISLALEPTTFSGGELVVVGYGTQEKESITGSISSVSSEDLEKVNNGSTVSAALAGQIPGLSFRQAEGRPGASASIQIRNMGTPLYVIDGIVKDEGQFNNLSPKDIETMSVLKDASAAAIYGSRAANGVVIVKTKRGALNTPTEFTINTYVGFQNMTRYPDNVLTSGYEWTRARAYAEVNQFGNTSITQEELDKWKAGEEYGYQSFDWPSFIFNKNAPQVSVNASASGGSENTNYYFSVTRLNQDAVFDQYNFNRTNLQSNIDTRIGDNLTVGLDINGRIESRVNPGVPGVDDYFKPLFATVRNRPTEQAYANGNPNYLNDIGHTADNAALWNYETTGKFQQDWRVIQTNLHADYELPIDGLEVGGSYSFYYANQYQNNHEFTFDAYTYDPVNETYNRTGGSTNPYQERTQQYITENVYKGNLSYLNSFGNHNIDATLVTEWFDRTDRRNYQHNVPSVNELDIIRFNALDTYDDSIYEEARIGYAGRFAYNYDERYYVQFSGRYDASWKWTPENRWGFFPSASIGWRLTEEPFFKSLIGDNSVLSNLKLRASYGELGDDSVPIGNYAYIPGYNYAVGTVILDGNAINTSDDRGVPVTNVTWFTSAITDIGVDFSFFNDKLQGTADYFYRKREGLLARKYDVLIPNEVGYGLPQENLNSDAQYGGEFSLSYSDNAGELSYSVRANATYSRSEFLHSYKPRFGNSWDRYRFSGEERYTGIFWGYQVIGQFDSQEEVNNYPVNVDGQGNTTLLPGDLIYKDVNEDGAINGYDERPIGYNAGGQPNLYGGFGFSLGWKGINLNADFSFGGMYAYNRDFEAKWPFQNGGNLLKSYLDRWHRADVYDLDSEWIEGDYPPLRFNDPGHSNYNKNSDYWLVNIRYFRLRTLEVGYTLPSQWVDTINLKNLRVYVNTYNLFSLDNLNSGFIDPEITSGNGLQYPQSKYVNLGIDITF